MKRFAAGILILVATAAACERLTGPGQAVTLVAEPALYVQGDSLTLTLRNGSIRMVRGNLCWAWVDRLQDGGWVEQPRYYHIPSDIFCSFNTIPLQPGQEHTWRYVPDRMVPGTYRIRHHLGVSEEPIWAYSNTFTVIEGE